MYEVASQCNAVLTSSSRSAVAAVKTATANLDDSYSQLAIKKSSASVTVSGSVGDCNAEPFHF